MKRFFLSLLLTVLFFLPVEGMVSVRLRASVRLGSRTVRLGDIARISGDDGRLGGLLVARLADGERETVLPYDQIRKAISESGREGIVLIGGDVRLRLRTVRVSRSLCLMKVRNALEGRFPGAGFTLNVKSSLPELVSGVRSLVLEGEPVVKGKRWHARFRAVDGEGMTHRFLCRGDIARQVLIPVAARDLKAGMRVAAADIVIRRFPEGTAGVSPVEGRVLKNDIKKGTSFTHSDLKAPEPFRAGSRVRVLWKAPGIRIVFYGRALEPGRPGERIRFRNELTGRIMHARVARGRLLTMDGGDRDE